VFIRKVSIFLHATFHTQDRWQTFKNQPDYTIINMNIKRNKTISQLINSRIHLKVNYIYIFAIK
jgi:hypothetical protein